MLGATKEAPAIGGLGFYYSKEASKASDGRDLVKSEVHLEPSAEWKKESTDGGIPWKRLCLFGHADAAEPVRGHLEGGINTLNKLLSNLLPRATMAEMHKIQKRDALKLSDKIDASNRLGSEGLMGTSEIGKAINGWTVEMDFDEISLSNSREGNGVPTSGSNAPNAKYIAGGE
jgi:hypothetical protein